MPSTPINQIRSFIQDKPLFNQETIQNNGGLVYQLKFFPISLAAGGVLLQGTPPFQNVTPAPSSIDYENGVLTFSAPVACASFNAAYWHTLLSDQSLQDAIDVEMNDYDDIRVPAADCLDMMASNQTIIMKKIRMLDLETDGAAMAKSLRDHAANLRSQVFDPKYNEPFFDVAETVEYLDTAAWKEKVVKDWQREGLF